MSLRTVCLLVWCAVAGAQAFAEALLPALQSTRKAKLKLCLENSVWTGPEEFNAFFGWLQSKQRSLADHVGMCFDLGHANVCEATRNDYCRFLDQLAPTIPMTHLHLHENFGDRDTHLPLFTGPSSGNPAGLIGLIERLRARGFSGCGILEQWPDPSSLLTDARDRLKLLLNVVG